MPQYRAIHKQLEEWQLNDSIMLKNNKLLQKIHHQTRKKSISYIQSLQKRKSRPQSSPTHSIDIKPSINQLRQMATQQKLQASKIQNRLKYLHTSTERQEKLVNTAKEKFYKINQVRRKSFTEKSFFGKERKSLLMQHEKTVHLKASAIKSERIRTTQSQQKALEQKKSKAQVVKQQKEVNESIIKDMQQHQKSIKSEKVIQVQKQEKLQKQKMMVRSKERIEAGIINHKNVIMSQYHQVQRQMKMKRNLMKSFEEKASQIYKKKQQQQKELQQYRKYLGLNMSEVTQSRISKTQKNSSRQQAAIDDTMLFKSGQKKVPTQNKIHSHSSASNYNSKTKGKVEMGIYLTNPEYY